MIPPSGRIYQCTECHALAVWGESWLWYGSYKMCDDDPDSLLFFCRPSCAEAWSERTGEGLHTKDGSTPHKPEDAETQKPRRKKKAIPLPVELAKPARRWCDECVNFGGNTTGCRRNFQMEFTLPACIGSIEWGFYRTNCVEFSEKPKTERIGEGGPACLR